MFGKQSRGSFLPALVLTVGIAGISQAAGQTPEQDIKQADAKVNALPGAIAVAKRQMDAANNIAHSARASKNLPTNLVIKTATDAQYRKNVYVSLNLELQSAKKDKARAEANLAAARSKASADAAAVEKKNADAKAEEARRKAEASKKVAEEAAARAVAAKKDPKVAAATENKAAAKAKSEYDSAAAAAKKADAKAAATAANATKAEAAATKAKNAAMSAETAAKMHKHIAEQSKVVALSAAGAWETQKKQMANNPFYRACDNVDREITATIEKAKEDPVAAAASVVKTAIGGVDGLVTGAISAAANTPWFKGTKVGTTVDIATYLKELPGKPKDTAIDQIANLVSSVYKAKTAKEAFNLFSKAEEQRKNENFTELVDKVLDLIKAYDKDFDPKTYRKALLDTYELIPPGAKF